MTPARSFERDFFGLPPRAHRLAKLVTHGRDGRRVRISWRVGVARANHGPRVAFFVSIRAESDYFVVSLQPKHALWEKEN